MGLNAEGSVTVTLAEPEADSISYIRPDTFNMTGIEVDRFYNQIHKLGYEYAHPFRGLLDIQRSKSHAIGTMEDQGGSEWEDQLLIHPGMLDTAIQSSSAAFGCPGDGMMWTLYIPTGIQSIIINPYFTSHGVGKQQVLPWETISRGMIKTHTTMDINIFSEDNEHTFIQVEGLKLMPFTAARKEDDANIFSSLDYRIDRPNDDLAVVNDGWDESGLDAALKGERVSFYYLRRLVESITPEEKASTLPHYQHLLN
jgi:hybrid polyketide synthase/nonribosomal peptide synthetase ACE1